MQLSNTSSHTPLPVYDLYKPLRNYLRKFELLDSLTVIWSLIQYFQMGQKLLPQIKPPPQFLYAPTRQDKQLFEWELELLAREIILNASIGTRTQLSLANWNVLALVVNRLKSLEDNIFQEYGDVLKQNLLIELYRVAHRQFPWQRRPNTMALARYFRIFGDGELAQILLRKTGMSARELYLIGLVFSGHFTTSPIFHLPVRIEMEDLSVSSVDRFLQHFSTSLRDIQEAIKSSRSFDEDYAYTYNPMKAWPLITINLQSGAALISPIPTYLYWRFTEGVYYELTGEPDFGRVFGASFQRYIGDVIGEVNNGNNFSLLQEKEYTVGKLRKDSVDWILSDASATLFIECKTKRVRADAKMRLDDTSVLDADLEKMSDFVVQTYKTLSDAVGGHYSHWRADARPIFPVIITLDDWYLFGDRIYSALEATIRRKASAAKIDDAFINAHPYAIFSVQDFELIVQVMRDETIFSVMRVVTSAEKSRWNILGVMSDDFRDSYRRAQQNHLFRDDLAKIHPILKKKSN